MPLTKKKKKKQKNAQFHANDRETTEKWFKIQNKQDFILIYRDRANI